MAQTITVVLSIILVGCYAQQPQQPQHQTQIYRAPNNDMVIRFIFTSNKTGASGQPLDGPAAPKTPVPTPAPAKPINKLPVGQPAALAPKPVAPSVLPVQSPVTPPPSQPSFPQQQGFPTNPQSQYVWIPIMADPQMMQQMQQMWGMQQQPQMWGMQQQPQMMMMPQQSQMMMMPQQPMQMAPQQPAAEPVQAPIAQPVAKPAPQPLPMKGTPPPPAPMPVPEPTTPAPVESEPVPEEGDEQQPMDMDLTDAQFELQFPADQIPEAFQNLGVPPQQQRQQQQQPQILQQFNFLPYAPGDMQGGIPFNYREVSAPQPPQ